MTCSIDNCGRAACIRGLCGTHYKRWSKYGTPTPAHLSATIRPRRLSVETLREFIDVGDCWTWKQNFDSDGYGRVQRNGRGTRAHRAVFELLVGPIPEGLQLDHLCRNRPCVNPDHLEPVTCKENLRRSRLTQATLNASKTYCVNGHPFSEANTYVKPNGHRLCRECQRAANRAWIARRQAAS